jgi:hypothetical protein
MATSWIFARGSPVGRDGGRDHWYHNGCDKHLKPGDEVPVDIDAPEPGPVQQMIDWIANHKGLVIGGAIVVGRVVIIVTGGAAAPVVVLAF